MVIPGALRPQSQLPYVHAIGVRSPSPAVRGGAISLEYSGQLSCEGWGQLSCFSVPWEGYGQLSLGVVKGRAGSAWPLLTLRPQSTISLKVLS